MNSKTHFIIFAMLCCLSMSLVANADYRFSDVPEASSLYQSVTYLYEHGITYGIGNNYFSPSNPITPRQWAVMLCRAYGERPELDNVLFGDIAIQNAVERGWLTSADSSMPDEPMRRCDLYRSAFRIALSPDFDSNPSGSQSAVVSRGEAALLLHAILTGDPAVSLLPFICDGITDEYLSEIGKVPNSILVRFISDGWSFDVNQKYLEDRSIGRKAKIAGITNYQSKTIIVGSTSAVLHEFGHFLDRMLNQDEIHEILYKEEAQQALPILREYSLKSRKEYFADSFAFWIRNKGNQAALEKMKNEMPRTHSYFCLLEENGWCDFDILGVLSCSVQ